MERQPLAELVTEQSIRLFESAGSRDDAIRLVGRVLVESGAVDTSYVEGMLERENTVSTWVGENLAFPHATHSPEGSVHRDAIAVVRFPDGVDWDGNDVRVAIGIAALGRGHIGLLSRLARVLVDPASAADLRRAESAADVLALLDRPLDLSL